MPRWSSKTKNEQGSPASTMGATPTALRSQLPTYASTATKIRLSMLATAIVDALGGPVEFHKRSTFPFVTSMTPNFNFNLPPGVWTDDTSMMLCLASSISTSKESAGSTNTGGFDQVHQLELYTLWRRDGHLSAIGRCFDVGNQISRALTTFESYDPEEALHRIQADLGGDASGGNGSLMRILPIGLAYWRNETQAKQYARLSSQATHPSIMCVEVCEMWTGLISLIMEEINAPRDTGKSTFSKLTLLEYISNFPYTHAKLRDALTMPSGIPPRPEDKAAREQWYWSHHPLLRLIAETQGASKRKEGAFPYTIPPADRLPSSGYVLHTSVAALYCFFTTKNFEEGALLAVNLGDDADTVGAVYAGLAGCWYSGEEDVAEEIFWTERVREWRKALVKQELVEEVAEKLVSWERKQANL